MPWLPAPFVRRCAAGLAAGLCTLGAWSAPPGADRPLPADIATALARAKVPRDAVALLVLPLDGRAAPLAHRVDADMNPASVMKLVTTLAALDTLGGAFTWKTHFYADGPVADGTLHGHLYIRGGGDPKLVLERVDAAFRALQAQGVRRITGDMVLDNSIFDDTGRDPAAFDGEPLRPYNATPDGLLVNFKALILKFVPQIDGGVAQVLSEPPLAGVQVDASVPVVRRACGDWQGALQADFSDPARVRFQGAYPTGCGERAWPVAYVEPASYAARALRALFLAAGGTLDGQVRSGAVPRAARPLMAFDSLPLAEVIADVNKFSNNVMAQQVFLTLGAQRQPPGNLASARDALQAWWHRFMGKETPAPVVDNGAGLSRDERIRTSALGRMLQRAAAHAEAATFQQSMSLAGVDGTAARLRDRGLAPSAVGQVWLKTGSLRDVASIAGYATGRSGRRYVVVGMVNHANAQAARAALDLLLEWTVTERWESDRGAASEQQAHAHPAPARHRPQ